MADVSRERRGEALRIGNPRGADQLERSCAGAEWAAMGDPLRAMSSMIAAMIADAEEGLGKTREPGHSARR